jgi:general secretion pathway protein L
MIGDQATNVLIHSEQLVLTEVRVTARSQRQATAALPYVLEEQLADAPEKLHFASRACDTKGHYQVAIIDQQLLTSLVTQITEQGIRLTGLYADSQALPATESITLLIGDDRVLVRQSDGLGFAATLPVASVLLRKSRAQNDAIQSAEQISCYCIDSSREPASPFLQALDIDPGQCRAVAQPLELLARGLDPEQAINLLQGKFKAFIAARPARAPLLPLLLMTLLLALVTADQWIERRHQVSQLKALNTLTDRTYRQQFSEPAPVVNFRQALDQRLAERAQPAPLTADFINQFSSLLAHFPAELRIERIEYRDSGLQLSLRATGLTAATQLGENLLSANIPHSIQITERQKHQVLLRLTVDTHD